MQERPTADVLVVDRDPALGREVLSYLRDRHYRVEWVDDGEKAFNRLDSRFFDVLVSDLNLPRVDGLRLMAVARERYPHICVVFIAQTPEIERATEAMRLGAYDYQTKPLNLAKLEAVIQHGLAYQRLALEQVELKRRLDERFGLGSLTGQSRQMVQVYSAVRQAGPTHATVLITGAPGTGKDLIAQALHNVSTRRDEPFVKLDCAASPEALTSAELFGTATSRGRFELADQGTLYLEGVDRLAGTLQQKLRETLEKSSIVRPGDGKRIPLNVRVLASAPSRLDGPVNQGRYDAGLAKRLSEVIIEAPSLHSRREDIPLLIQEILRRISERHGKRLEGLTRQALDVFLHYDWPGNVRELENVLEGMALYAQPGATLGVRDLPEYLLRSVTAAPGEIRLPAGSTMREIERRAIEATMLACGHDKKQCAKTLGIGLRTLYRKLKEYELDE